MKRPTFVRPHLAAGLFLALVLLFYGVAKWPQGLKVPYLQNFPPAQTGQATQAAEAVGEESSVDRPVPVPKPAFVHKVGGSPAEATASNPQRKAPGEVPKGLDHSDWDSIWSAHDHWLHSFVEVDDGYRVKNKSQAYVAAFDGTGVSILPNGHTFEWGIRLASIEQGDTRIPLSPAPKADMRAEGRRLEVTRTPALTEWFDNRADGVQQGWILAQRPASNTPEAPLRLILELQGDLEARLANEGTGLEFVTPEGDDRGIHYGGLVAFDAKGSPLPASFELVSSNRVAIRVLDMGASYPITIDPIIQQTVLFSNTGAVDNFGISVAVSGDTVVVGASGEDSDATGADGNQADNSAEDSGAAYVFVRNGTTWKQQAYLKASNTGAGDYFGSKVAVSDATVVVGAFGESSAATGVDGNQADNSATWSGAAYVFVHRENGWSQQGYLKASNTEAYDWFSESVAVSGDTVVVGASGEDSAARGADGNQVDNSTEVSGAAYVFVRSGAAWKQQTYLKASNTEADDNFGLSVAVSDDTVVVGAQGESSAATGVDGNQADNSATDSGAAYVFVRSGTTWKQQAYLKASNTGAYDFFGSSVAVSGDTVVVGAFAESSAATGVDGNQTDNSAAYSGAAYVFVRNENAWKQQAYLKASNTEADDFFGLSVAVSGDRVAVGGAGEDSAATGVDGNQGDNSVSDSGAAYVFVRSGATWKQQAYLKASNTEAFDYFGESVAVSGDTVVMGTPGEDSAGNQADNSVTSSGAAYVYMRSENAWKQQAYLKASDSGAGDFFGSSVAVSGDTVVVGADGEDSAATGADGNQADNSAENSGAAYVFVRSGTTWRQQAYLKASNTEANDFFGSSVAVLGDTIVVGAIREDSAATGVDGNQADNSAEVSGAAYVFVHSGTTWVQQAYLKASNTGAVDLFGSSVAVSGDTVVVGAYREASAAMGVDSNQGDNSATFSGAAYVFVRTGTTWSQQAYLKASNTGAGDNFGSSVAVSGDTVVVGAYREESSATGADGNQANNSATDSGAVYVFVRSENAWKQQAYLKASNTGVFDSFGISVAVSGDTVVVGASGEDSAATGADGNQRDNSITDSGAVYVFVRSEKAWSQQAYLKASNTGAGDRFGRSVAVSGDTIVVGAPAEDSAATGVDGNQGDNSADGSGAAYLFMRSGTTWNQQAYLKASNTASYFAESVAVSGDTVVIGGGLVDKQCEVFDTSLVKPLVVSSADSANGTAGQAFSYQITASNSPSSFDASNLPLGLSVNPSTGLISGIPVSGGSSTVIITASNAYGTGSKVLTLTIYQEPPVVTSAGTANGTQGQAFRYQITASNSPSAFDTTELPLGLSVNRSTGLISGIPTSAGSSTVTIYATNGGGTKSKLLNLTFGYTTVIVSSTHLKHGWHPPFSDVVPFKTDPLTPEVQYDMITFTVPTDGTYEIISSAKLPLDWEHTLFLYDGDFNPKAPETAGLMANRSDITTNAAQIKYSLSHGRRYIAVVSGTNPETPGLFNFEVRPAGDGATLWKSDATALIEIPEMPGQLKMQATTISGDGRHLIGFAESMVSGTPVNYAVRYNLESRTLQTLLINEEPSSTTTNGNVVLMKSGAEWRDDRAPTNGNGGAPTINIWAQFRQGWGELQGGPILSFYRGLHSESRGESKYVYVRNYESEDNWTSESAIGTDLSEDGRFIVGIHESEAFIIEANSVETNEGFDDCWLPKLDENGNPVDERQYYFAATLLYDLEGGDLDAGASGVSANGSIVVGYGTSENGNEAVIWDIDSYLSDFERRDFGSSRPITFKDLLGSAGITSEDWNFTQATGVSNNGRVIVGNGVYRGISKPWFATIKEYSPILTPRSGNTIIGMKVGIAQVVKFFLDTYRRATSFEAVGLPDGVVMNRDTGDLEGTPQRRGVFPLVIYASNSAGVTKIQTPISIIVGEPRISAPQDIVVGYTDVNVETSINTDNGGSLSIDRSTLPPGLGIEYGSGNTSAVIYGFPTIPGSYSTKIKAYNQAGLSEMTVQFDIKPPAAGFWSDQSVSCELGRPFLYKILTKETSIKEYHERGLPNGLQLDSVSGIITGVPTSVGEFPTVLSVTTLNNIRAEYKVIFHVSSDVPLTITGLTIETGGYVDFSDPCFQTGDDFYHDGVIVITNHDKQWSNPGYIQLDQVRENEIPGAGFDEILKGGNPININQLGSYFPPIAPGETILVHCGESTAGEFALVAVVWENVPDVKFGDTWNIKQKIFIGEFEDYNTSPPSGGITLTRNDLGVSNKPAPRILAVNIEPTLKTEVSEGEVLKLNWKAVWSDGFKYSSGSNKFTIVGPSAGCSITDDGQLVTRDVTEDTYITVMAELNFNNKATIGRKTIKIKNLAPPAVAPTVTTAVVRRATHESATTGGTVTDNGGVIVSERGVVYGTAENPTVANAAKVASGGGDGTFTTNLNGLSANTTYYLRAYAINSVGTQYGAQISFITKAPPAPPQPFQITEFSIPDSGPVRVQFRAQAGLVYGLERSRDLQSWNVVETLSPGASGIFTLQDTSARPEDGYFYRISETR